MNGYLQTWRDAWNEIRPEAGRWVTSWKVWVAFFPLGSVALFVNVFNGNSQATWRACVAGYLIGGLMLWLASVSILRRRKTEIVPARTVLIVWFICAAATYLSALVVVARLSGSDLNLTTDSMLIAARCGLTYTLNRAVAVAILASFSLGRAGLRELEETRVELELTLGEVDTYIGATKARYVDFISESIRPRLRQIQRDLALTVSSGMDRDALAVMVDRFDQLTNQDVRPLSHSLIGQESDDQAQVPTWQQRKLDDSLASPPSLRHYIPPVIPVAILLVSVASGWLLSRPATSVVPLSLAAVLWPSACIAIARVMTKPWRRSDRWVHGVVPIVTAMSILFGLVAISMAAFRTGQLRSLSGLNDDQSMLIRTLIVPATIITVAALGWAVSYAPHRLKMLKESVRHANARLEQIIVSREIESERIRQTLSHLVHGPIQGRLALATMILRRMQSADDQSLYGLAGPDESSEGVSIEQVDELLELVETDLDRLSELVTMRTLDEYLRSAANEMRRLATLTWTQSPELGELLEQHPALDRRLTMLVEEVVGNAFRHGRAEFIHVWLDVVEREPLSIDVVVTDDGVGVANSAQGGLGLRMFDALSDSWDLRSDPGSGAVFRARVTDRTALLLTGRAST